MKPDEAVETARFFQLAIQKLGGFQPHSGLSVLDFGCGAGHLVEALAALGCDAHGCDLALHRKERPILNNPDRFREIPALPYAIPFADGTFNIVVSASVLEHAKNPAECFKEIHRVLKPGGCALHLFPGKWYLPCEPHTLVPMANYFFPHCPRWWFAVWSLLGMSGPSRVGRSWREATRMCENYYRTGLFYMSSGDHRRLSRVVFGNCDWPMEFYIAHAQGGMARLCRSLPFPKLWGILSREFRMAFMMQRKVSEGRAVNS